ncbi:Zinc finger, C6HC-type [Artemisia annua]|uniref:Zinc finger, C6HC-type n=1 Tax=Artemisia annua TaxID=35608 RepID=A0A2U1KWU5_ARTAN|nr:Zinc finger, C6HC-type [Artemisia annua]
MEDIEERQQKDIKCLLIVDDAHDAWFNDIERVCKDVGLLHMEDIKSLEAKELICGICFDPYPLDSIKTTGCAYISISINDGPGCLSLRCPDPSCHVAVGVNMAKWCPAPGCECAVEFDIGSENYDCTEDAHRPVECDTVTKWVLKNSAESENKNWFLANSKPCPKCKRPIEKNHGLPVDKDTTLHDNGDHVVGNEGILAPSQSQNVDTSEQYDEVESRREMAKNSLEKYIFFYERWAANHSLREKALDNLNKLQTEDVS